MSTRSIPRMPRAAGVASGGVALPLLSVLRRRARGGPQSCPVWSAAKTAGASPVLIGWLAPHDGMVVVAVLDHLAPLIEAQHRHPRGPQVLALPGPADPPFDCGPVARDDRLADPALPVLPGRDLLAEVAADTG